MLNKSMNQSLDDALNQTLRDAKNTSKIIKSGELKQNFYYKLSEKARRDLSDPSEFYITDLE